VAIGVGYRCTANAVVPNQTRLVAGQAGTDTLRVVPTGADSVITGWGVSVGAGIGPIAQQLVVFEPLGNGAYRKVAESRLETLSAGTNSFDARIPVKGGESVGLFGPSGTLACNGEAETSEPTEPISLRSEGSVQIGGTMSFQTESGVGTPLSSSVEPDNDGDGYGDYGQDRCLETASRGSDCPIGVSISQVKVNRRAILLEVTPAARARLRVRGEFLWHAPADRPGKPGRLVGADRETPTKLAGANDPRTFRVPLPRQVLRRLNRMRRGNSMVARIEVHVTDRHGWDSEERTRIAIWGRR
jgi:hypothetical protein